MAAPPLFHPGRELPILWEGAHLAVISKPAGLAAHPGPQTRDSVESRLLPQKRGGPWLVHRLDADTAGCFLIARRKTALITAQRAFAERRVSKHYWALVHGRPQGNAGTLETALRRISTPGEGWRMLSETLPEQEQTTPATHKGRKNRAMAPSSRSRITETGKPARTSWRLLASDGTTSLLELTLHTGRTHQARVHCAALGTPIIGDRIYGAGTAWGVETPRPPAGAAPLRLLARSLSLPVSPADDRASPAMKAAHVTPVEAIAHDDIMDAFLKRHRLPL